MSASRSSASGVLVARAKARETGDCDGEQSASASEESAGESSVEQVSAREGVGEVDGEPGNDGVYFLQGMVTGWPSTNVRRQISSAMSAGS